MARKATKKPTKTAKKTAPKASQKTSAPLKRHRPAETPQQAGTGLLDENTKRDIVGVSFIVLAVVFFLLVVLPADGAIVSGYVSEWIHLIFGVGAYLFPLVLAGIGISFLCKSQAQHISGRTAVGLTILFVALLGFIAVFTPTASLGADDLNLLFATQSLINHGGYVGAGLAFAVMSLFGRLIAGVIFVGFMIIGIVVVGFSVSKALELMRIKKRQLEQRRAEEEANTFGSRRLRMRKAEDVPLQGTPPAQLYPNSPHDANITQPLMATHAHPEALSAQLTRPLADAQEVFHPLPNLVSAEYEYDDYDEEQEDALGKDAYARLDSWPAQHLDIPLVVGENAISATRLNNVAAAPENSLEPATPKSENPATTVRLEAPKELKKPRKSAIPGITRDGFTLPSMMLLKQPAASKQKVSSQHELEQTAIVLRQTLESFGIKASVVGWIEGPTVTLFKVDLPSGVRVSRITNLNDDIALALASPGVRIFAPIPGTNYVGIEIPNQTRQTVLLSEVLQHAQNAPLELAIGKDVEGHAIISDLAKMPHLLIGGTTGSGKSVSINAMIMSILMRCTPSEVRFIMIDPKRVEFTPYNGIPHLYVPVVTEPKEAASALAWGVAEMERRLKVFSSIGARNIVQYNTKVRSGGIEDKDGRELEPLPYIVIIIDELADLMMNVGKEVEFSISRIAQLARAAGIHLIVATQRPSTNVVTGLIKANITNRIAFNVASGIDSRVILDTPGAENLIGLGDMLLSKPELPKPHRIQACYVSEDEIEAVVDFVKAQAEPEYHADILKTNVISMGDTSPQGGVGSVDDPLVWEAAEMVVSSKMGSTSNIQRRLKVGYARAGRIMDQLEDLGIVGPANGSKPREVLVDAVELETLKAFESQN